MAMARARTSCLLVCLLAVLTRGVTALDCAPQCRCYGTTVDCSHGTLTEFPRNQLIPTSTEVLLLNDNQLSEVRRDPQLPNLLELSLEDNSITALTRNPFIYQPNLQILRLGGNAISDLPASAFNGLSQLVRLYLNKNTITTITAFGSNSVVNRLKMLDLQDNKLTSISIGTFTGVSLLTELNLSSNNISAIEDGSFSHLKELRVLYLHSNHIGMLNSATFVGMSALTRLTLSNNKIQSLPDVAFIGAPNLEFLDLSLNDLSTITQVAFSGLYNLTTLLLGNNKISSIEDWAFGDLVKMQSLVLINNFLQNMSAATFTSTEVWELDLANNGLTTIRRGDFARLRKLKYLHIYANDIANVEDFSFENLANLKVLEIFGNRLTNVSAATFKGLVSVEHIGMGGHPEMVSFPDDTFWDLPKLAHLGLLGNQLVSISDAVFSPLQSLKSIAMSNCKLSSLPALPVSLESLLIINNRPLTELRPGDFTTLPRSETGDHLPLPNLTSLVLSESGLQKIHPFAFATLPALTSLNLYRNSFQSISSIDSDAFGNLTTLLSLNVDEVTTLSPRVFRHLPCLQSVTLGEKLTCDCDLLDLVKWIKKTTVNPSPPTCWFPRKLRERSLKSLGEEELGTCSTDNRTTAPPTTDPMVQICPTLSPSLLTTTLSQSPPVTTPKSSKPQAVAVGMPESAVLGLAVGVPLFLIILAMAAGFLFLRRKGRPSAEPVRQTQQQEAPIGLAEVITDDPPYDSINEDQRDVSDDNPYNSIIEDRRGSQETPYQNPETVTEPVADRITSSYLQFAGVEDSMNSPDSRTDDEHGHDVSIPTPRSGDDQSSSVTEQMADNIYNQVEDDGSEQEQSASPDENNVYIDIIG
ncbi:hypothetical protein Bbelb_226900 [Branchiostoma belcheri]|nr:hypothetical protein Bbelb_226900 [Branchiostoma belcheri]